MTTTTEPNWFAEAMERKGIRSGWMAEQLGVGVNRVSEWKSGTRPVPERHVARIRELLGLDQ